MHRELDARETASFLIAVYEGYVMLAKMPGMCERCERWGSEISPVASHRFARQIRKQD